MKKTIISLAFFLSSAFYTSPLLANDKLPSNIQLVKLTNGKVKTLKDIKGKPAVIEFWATWCEACGPSMHKLALWAKKNRQVQFLPVSVDETLKEAQDYFKKGHKNLRKLKKINYFDRDALLASSVDISALPATMVVDSKGKVVKIFTGKVDNAKIKKIEAALKKAS